MYASDHHDDDYDGHRFFVGFRNALYIEALVGLAALDLLLWWFGKI